MTGCPLVMAALSAGGRLGSTLAALAKSCQSLTSKRIWTGSGSPRISARLDRHLSLGGCVGPSSLTLVPGKDESQGKQSAGGLANANRALVRV